MSTESGQGRAADALTLFVCGDVMLGRGVDQILPNPSKLQLFEPCVSSAATYVELAERASGPIRRPVGFDYVWGDALAEFERVRPEVRIVNLETAVTVSPDAWPQKRVHYRMHPANVPCLTAAGIDCCVLANNHVMDWGHSGLEETLAALRAAGIRTAGAGRDDSEAGAPAIIESAGRRLLVFGFAVENSGVPRAWTATRDQPGVNCLKDLSPHSVDLAVRQISRQAGKGDVVVASIHWGGNWGYEVSPHEREFAHRLIDRADVDLVHGHSSHHARGIEVYHHKAILYGCGDLLNDYEGIAGHEDYRGDLGLMYFPALDPQNGNLLRLSMMATRTRHFRINRAPPDAAAWLSVTLERECRKLGSRPVRRADGSLALEWDT